MSRLRLPGRSRRMPRREAAPATGPGSLRRIEGVVLTSLVTSYKSWPERRRSSEEGRLKASLTRVSNSSQERDLTDLVFGRGTIRGRRSIRVGAVELG